MTDWKERYDQLASLTNQFTKKVQELDLIRYRINNHVEESDRKDLYDRNKSRYMRLKEDVTITPEYDSGRQCEPRSYTAGTLRSSRLHLRQRCLLLVPRLD